MDAENASGANLSLDDILITAELARRPARQPEYQAESQALAALAEEMASHPDGVLKKLVELAMELCRAGSASICVLGPGGEHGIFRWPAAAGPLTAFVNGIIAGNESPCSAVMARNELLLFRNAGRVFPALGDIEPRIYESLFVPWTIAGKPAGALWLVHHRPDAHFDREDARLLMSLSRFASVAFQMVDALQTARDAQQELEQQVHERTRALENSEVRAQSIAANLPSGAAFVVDHDLRYQFAGGEALGQTGLTTDVFVGRCLDEVLPPALFEQYAANYRQALAGEPFKTEHEVHGRFYLTRGVPLRNGEGEIYAALAVSYDITERKHAEAALWQSEQRLRLLVDNVQEYAVFQTDMEGVVTSWNPGAERLFGYTSEEMLGHSALLLFTSEDQETGVLRRELEEARSGKRTQDARFVLSKHGRRFWAQWVTEPVLDEAGQLHGVVKVLRDESERKQAEERQRLLMGELNHRVRNTLATVQSIARQTLRTARDPEDFVGRFQARLRALSGAHDLLTSTTWEEAEVAAIIREQLALDGDGHRISYSGPKASVDPQTSLALGLVLHELGTNALKHGALSVPDGKLTVTWRIEGHRETQQLNLEWVERHGPRVEKPARTGLGTMLINKSLKGVSGESNLRFDPEGVSCIIRLPLVSAGNRDPEQ